MTSASRHFELPTTLWRRMLLVAAVVVGVLVMHSGLPALGSPGPSRAAGHSMPMAVGAAADAVTSVMPDMPGMPAGEVPHGVHATGICVAVLPAAAWGLLLLAAGGWLLRRQRGRAAARLDHRRDNSPPTSKRHRLRLRLRPPDLAALCVLRI